MSNEAEVRFRCLICSTSCPRLGVGLSTTSSDKSKEDRKNLYKTFLVLHKILQIPIWECAGYLLSAEGNVTNSLKLCPLCADKVDQGRSLLEQVDVLQAQLQTLQATLQNQVLSSQIEVQGEEDEDQTQNSIRNRIREEILKNVYRSSLQPSCGNGDSNYGGGDNVSSVPIDTDRDAGNSRTTPGSTPVLAEETPTTEEEEVEQAHLRMEFEVGELKTEGELARDPLAFSYEVIDLASDSDEVSTEERGQDLDAMVAEVTKGAVLYDGDKSQLEIRSLWSTQSSSPPNACRDSSPLPTAPRRKRIRSTVSVQDNPCPPANSLVYNSSTSTPVQGTSQNQQHQQQSPEPGPSRQYLLPLHRTQSLPASTEQPNLLQMLLAPSSVPSPPNYANSASTQMQSLMPAKQVIWCGMLEWHERQRRREGGSLCGPRTQRMLCRVYSPVTNRLQSVSCIGWPQTLFMQCIPKPIMSATGPQILRHAKIVLFEFDQPSSIEVESLTKALGTDGYAGCVHFVGSSSAIKLMALVFVKSRNQFIGLIPEQQEMFVSSLKNVIQNYNQRQLQAAYDRQLATGQNLNPPANSNQQNTSVSNPGNQNVVQQQGASTQQWLPQTQEQQLPSQTVHHRPSTLTNSSLVTQRQLNLLKIQQLKQTLDQAQRTEMNFQIMQQGNNTISSFSMQQSNQQQSNSFNPNLNPGSNIG